jgi:acetyl-CoA C-acetyltransferase
LSTVPAIKLGSIAISGALRASMLDALHVDEVIMGQVLQGGVGQAPARQASLGANLSPHIPCSTINKVCGSGLKAVMLANDHIALGQARAIVAGGMESMSNAPYILPGARAGFRMGSQMALDLMIHDGLFDPYGQAHMGSFGDLCAKTLQVSREEQDNYAHESYKRALFAQKNGLFAKEIVPVEIVHKGSSKQIVDDEEPSRYLPEKFAQLKPVFSTEGSTTPANASKVSDGAAALVVAEEGFAREHKLPIAARIITSATFAQEPEWFTTAPIKAIEKVLKMASLSVADVDIYEINEAFSVVAIAAIKELGIKHERVNVFGGAVSLGHPIGSSGARLLVTLVTALKHHNKRFGCVALCLGGGEAVAMLIEKL